MPTDAIRNAIETQRPGSKVQPLRPSVIDPHAHVTVIEGDRYRAPRESERSRRKP